LVQVTTLSQLVVPRQARNPQGVAVVTCAPGTMADLQPGAHVIFFPTAVTDGSLTASQINVGKNG
jgi:hypothetical protein